LGERTLVRTFHWPARRQPSERIFLDLEQISGHYNISLNDVLIADGCDPWGTMTLDITDDLRPSNQLIVHVTTPEPGMPFPLGIRGSVSLRVESADLRFSWSDWQMHEPERDNALGLRLTVETRLPIEDLEVVMELDAKVIYRQPLRNYSHDGVLDGEEGLRTVMSRIDLGPFDVDPWRPAGFGLPILHEFRAGIVHAGEMIYQKALGCLGFRDIEIEEVGEESVVRCGGAVRRGILYRMLFEPDSIGPLLQTPPLRTPGSVLSLREHVATWNDYVIATGVGAIISHETDGDSRLEAALDLLACHPSVIK
jgi:hypothetical protein